MTAERPINFNGEMVRAILEGRKTVTRRPAPISKLEFTKHDGGFLSWAINFSRPQKGGTLGSYSGALVTEEQARSIIASQFCPFGSPGDRREG